MTPKRLLQAIAMSLLLLFAVQASFAQDRTITGRVTDSKDGSPVSGVTVTATALATALLAKKQDNTSQAETPPAAGGATTVKAAPAVVLPSHLESPSRSAPGCRLRWEFRLLL